MSSERSLHRRSGGSTTSSNSSNHSFKPPQPSSSPRRGRRSPQRSKDRRSARSSLLPMEPMDINVLPKCSSEPLLMMNDDEDCVSRSFGSDCGVLYRLQTCTDIFTYNGVTVPESPSRSLLLAGEGYKKESKVVVTVTVEGSPGPIRTLVKLGCSVEDTIKLVIQKYGEEGRSPRLDKSSASSFDLHLSYFSLEGLEKSDTIGDVGSRSFYLRKSKNSEHTGDELEAAAATSISSEIVPVQPPNSLHQPPSPIVILPAFISQKINKIMRRMHKLWKIMGCLH